MNLLQRKTTIQAAGYRRSPTVTIRWAAPTDAPQLADLAALDEAAVPDAPVLLAFVGDELWVALSLATGATTADPFRPTADLVTLVRERGRQLAVPEPGLRRSGVRLPRPGWA